MSSSNKIRVVVNGYCVVSKRVDAVALERDTELAGIADVAVNWRARVVTQHGFRLFGVSAGYAGAVRNRAPAQALCP